MSNHSKRAPARTPDRRKGRLGGAVARYRTLISIYRTKDIKGLFKLYRVDSNDGNWLFRHFRAIYPHCRLVYLDFPSPLGGRTELLKVYR